MIVKSQPETTPSYYFIAFSLLIAVTMCSSAATVFNSLTISEDIPPFLAAFWRLFVQSVVQFFPFLWSLNDKLFHSKKEHGKYVTNQTIESSDVYEQLTIDHTTINTFTQDYIKSIPLMMISGISLGAHFSMWVYSLRYTSITHSLLWVSMGPIILNTTSWILYFVHRSNMKPPLLQTLGAFTGILGASIMLLDNKHHPITTQDQQQSFTTHQRNRSEPSLYGDLAAFSGAAAVCVYLVIGNKLRSWMPLWLYVFPVVTFASITCLSFAIFDTENPITSWSEMDRTSTFGFVSSSKLLFCVLYLAIGPGILGHTVLNLLLKYVSPLVVSTAMLSEPILGSFIGHAFGMQPLPGCYTLSGGFVLIFGLYFVICGEEGVIGLQSFSTRLLNRNVKGCVEEDNFQQDLLIPDNNSMVNINNYESIIS